MTSGLLVLRVQTLAVIVGLVSCLWLNDVLAAKDGKADVVLRNGKIYTADPARSFQQSIAFTGNSIVAVGDDDEVTPLIGPATKVVDLGGKLVLPGLIDTHTHPIGGAINGAKCSLADVKPTLEALKPVIQECLAKKPGGADDWFEAVQLDNYGFKATARDLDSIEETRPIVLAGNDGHAAWVNSRALDLTAHNSPYARSGGRQDPPRSLRRAHRLVGRRCPQLIEDKIPSPSVEQQASLTDAELKKMSADGITSLMDACVERTEQDVWRSLYRSGKLDMRVRMAICVGDPNDYREEMVARLVATSKEGDVDPNFLRAGVLKVFADGVMEYPAQTAALLRPYCDADGKPTKSVGELYFDPERFARLVQKLDAAGIALHVHAIGDRAVRTTLDAFAAARAANGERDNRHQIAHLQLIDPADFPRFKELGVIADFQLLWARREPATEGPLEPYLGPDRYRYLYPAGSLHAAGAMIVGGSDWDVSSYNPFRAFQTAVTRTGGKGQKPLNIDERIPLTTAVDAYTINAAFAMKQDSDHRQSRSRQACRFGRA